MSDANPSTNEGNGRDDKGRFTIGNPGGPGNPHAAKVARLRTAMLEAVDEGDMKEIIGKLKELATGGNVSAIKEILDRCLGRPTEADLLERLEQLEAMLEQAQHQRRGVA